MSDPIPRLNAALEGRYRIERQFGEGGMATVYLARDEKHNRNVALKVLKPELAAVVGADRFLAEIETTANLQHPHILPLFDSGEADSFLFYVMPYVEGESLRERLDREHQLPVDEAVQIAGNVAEALDYAHRQGVIHRDIKPANILLQDGKPVVSDFGIALAVGAAGGGRLTETGLSLGTPHYMSPEQATGDLSVGPAADIYALGCVLYEMLVGSPPFVASTPQAVLGKIVTGEAPSASAERKSVPPNVDAAIRKALEKVPADRFRAASEFARALLESAFRHDYTGQAWSGSDNKRTWRSTALVGWVLALLASSLWMTSRGVGEEEGSRSIRSILAMPQGVRLAVRPLGGAHSVAFTPDGNALIYRAISEDDNRFLGVMKRQLATLASESLSATDLDGVFFSPDGNWLAGVDARGRLARMPASGGPLEPIFDPVEQFGNRAYVGSWGSGDTIVFGLQGSSPIMKVSLDGGPAELATELDQERGEADHRHPTFLPGGDAFLFTAWNASGGFGQVAVQSLSTGQRTDLVTGTSPKFSPTGHLLYVRDGSLWAVAFDPETLELSGPETPVASGLYVDGLGLAHVTVADDGSLAYVRGAVEGRTLVWVDRSGDEEPVRSDPRPYSHPRLSPNGRHVAVAIDGDIYIHELEGEAPLEQLTFDPEYENHPFWTPDGQRMVFSSRKDILDGATRNLWWMRADGTGQAERLTTSSRTQSPWGWSVDGEYLVFQEGVQLSTQWDIGMVSVPDGETLEMLVASDNFEVNADVSPDGRWIAYEALELGERADIYVRPFPNVEDGLWRVSTNEGGGREPAWSPDGSEIYFQSGEAGGQMMAVPVQTGSGFSFGTPRRLFQNPDYFQGGRPTYDVAPDGRFLMLKQVGTQDPELVLVQNWQRELEESVPN